MTYSIVYDAIQIKLNRFETPAPLINANEVAAAMAICYRQAHLTPPEPAVGVTIGKLREDFFKLMDGKDGVDARLLSLIREYPNDEQIVDELAINTLRFGLTSPETANS